MRLLLVLLATVLSAQPPPSDQRPYVVLLSLDGFRYDYPDRYQTPNLLQMARTGVRAQALIPSYRSNTFPNHYSIATGLYPAHHGIVDNNFYDRARNADYVSTQKATGGDGSWYGGTPLWVLAEQQGVRAMAYFYPATDTEIQGTRPSRYFAYNSKVPNATRVDEVLSWLRLPEAERPHLITLYFSDADDVGHDAGPESPETAAAVADVDAQIGRLRDGLRATGLPVNLFVVADHGMMATSTSIRLGSETDFAGFHINPAAGSQIMMYSNDTSSQGTELVDRTYARLKAQAKRDGTFRVYRRAETPGYLHYRDNPRIGDLVLMAATPAVLVIERPGRTYTSSKGQHGFDTKRFPAMRGIFFAEGPQLRAGLRVKAFQNIHIYPLIAEILGLKITQPIDGKLKVLSHTLKR
jgi:predicted AlkP superfamily pyrophosphatase or phosphodiesterase